VNLDIVNRRILKTINFKILLFLSNLHYKKNHIKIFLALATSRISFRIFYHFYIWFFFEITAYMLLHSPLSKARWVHSNLTTSHLHPRRRLRADHPPLSPFFPSGWAKPHYTEPCSSGWKALPMSEPTSLTPTALMPPCWSSWPCTTAFVTHLPARWRSNHPPLSANTPDHATTSADASDHTTLLGFTTDQSHQIRRAHTTVTLFPRAPIVPVLFLPRHNLFHRKCACRAGP
jgi:hypothetical protein